MDYDLTTRPPRPLGFTNKTMRVIDETKPHIVFIEGFWRVSPYKRKNKAVSRRWYEAHAFATRLNNDIHVWPYIQPVPGELYK